MLAKKHYLWQGKKTRKKKKKKRDFCGSQTFLPNKYTQKKHITKQFVLFFYLLHNHNKKQPQFDKIIYTKTQTPLHNILTPNNTSTLFKCFNNTFSTIYKQFFNKKTLKIQGFCFFINIYFVIVVVLMSLLIFLHSKCLSILLHPLESHSAIYLLI